MKTKKIIVEVEWGAGLENYLAFPRNEQARYACKLLKTRFLRPDDLVILQKMGFEIKKLKSHSDRIFNKRFYGDKV